MGVIDIGLRVYALVDIAKRPDDQIEGPKEVQHCYDRTDVDGFLAASSVERLPVEPVLADVVQSYKNLRLKR